MSKGLWKYVFNVHGSSFCGIKMQQVDGGIFEDISFNNLVMENVTGPISLRLALWRGWGVLRDTLPPYGTFRNVSFSNIRARVNIRADPRPDVVNFINLLRSSLDNRTMCFFIAHLKAFVNIWL